MPEGASTIVSFPARKGSQSVSLTVALLEGAAIRGPGAPPHGTLSHGSVVVVPRQRGSRFLRVLPSLVEDLLDVVGRSYDGVDYVVLDDVHKTILDPGKSDHSLAAVGVVAQTGGGTWEEPPCPA